MLKVVILLLGLVVTGASCYSAPSEMDYGDQAIPFRIGEELFSVTVRDDIYERAQGLSGTESLEEGTGMLFIFSGPSQQQFWMKDMNYPLDFVWIRDGFVVGLNENIPHPDANNGEIARVSSPEVVDMVLELNGGVIKDKGIKKGDEIELNSRDN